MASRSAIASCRDAEPSAKGRLGGFFDEEHLHESWHWGVAASIAELLLKNDAQAYRQLVLGIKEGQTWRKACKTRTVSPADLVQLSGDRSACPTSGPTPSPSPSPPDHFDRSRRSSRFPPDRRSLTVAVPQGCWCIIDSHCGLFVVNRITVKYDLL